ncbi:unnamed protein product [Parajaminaea phylloscopi]
MTAEKMIHFRVTGRVQGVNFRSATVKAAQDLSLRGWVRNAADSSVEGAAHGDAASLSKFRNFLSQGPSAAKVDNVEVREVEEGSETLPHPFETRS